MKKNIHLILTLFFLTTQIQAGLLPNDGTEHMQQGVIRFQAIEQEITSIIPTIFSIIGGLICLSVISSLSTGYLMARDHELGNYRLAIGLSSIFTILYFRGTGLKFNSYFKAKEETEKVEFSSI